MFSALRMRRTASSMPPPHLQGVLVEVDGSGENGRPISSSGVRWGRLVLTHGSLLPPGEDAPEERPLQLCKSSGDRIRVVSEVGVEEGCFRASWRCPLLAASGRDLAFKGWNLINPRQQDMGLMLVVQVGEGDAMTFDEVRGQLTQLLQNFVAEPRTGQAVLLEATPFGAGNFFLNTWTRGIVNKVAGKSDCLILSDTHAAPGSEGGGLYCLQEGQQKLVGIVVQTLLQVRGEAVSLCLCASASVLLAAVLKIQPLVFKTPSSAAADTSSRGVALLKNAGSWASAVSLDSEKGIFLTCAHVLNGAKDNSVQLHWLSSNGPQKAKILYKSPSSSAFDVALLKTAVPGPKMWAKISDVLPSKGETVDVVGYGLLSPPGPGGSLHGPLVSRGCVSQSKPQMLQTSCAVHSGNSGGAVYQGSNLVGLVVGHTEITSAANVPKNWPKINFAVPMAAIAQPLNSYLQTGDPKVLKKLENFDPEATRLWTLNPIPNSKL